MITINNLSYRYPSGMLALSDISLSIAPGLHLLLGENGSGKTTLLHIIGSLRKCIPADACLIDGVSTATRRPSELENVFVLSDDMKFPYRTIRQMAERHGVFYPSFDREMLQRNLSAFGLNENDAIDRYSLGNRKKAQLAYVLALRPKVLLLDEPANGLDISSRNEFVRMLAESMTDEQTVIVSTHTVFDFQNIVDGVIVLSHGRLLLSRSVWDITSRLAFVSESVPVTGALFMQQMLGRFNAIVPNDGSLNTDLDFVLFFNALQSSEANTIINYLK